jgi:hypothetical protein
MDSAYNRLDLDLLTLYADLVAHVDATRRSRRGRLPPGTLVSKVVKGGTYWYVQYEEVVARRQVYLGPEGEKTEAQMAALRAEWDDVRADERRTARLVAMIQAGGVHAPDHAAARVLEVLGVQGLFDAGAVLVDSLAFLVYEPMLGVRWGAGYVTADVDIAWSKRLEVVIPMKLPDALSATGLPFDSIPALDPASPSTAFKVRGKALSVDVLVPEVGKPKPGPMYIPALGVHAQPLRFLDFLIDAPEPAALVARSGVFIRVPSPARFALHKLIVATRRPAAMQARAAKDLAQAEQLLCVLLEDRPGDVLLAAEQLEKRGRRWVEAARTSVARLGAGVRERLGEVAPALAVR